jgi:hypothetical protein
LFPRGLQKETATGFTQRPSLVASLLHYEAQRHTACGSGTFAGRLIRNTIIAATRHSPPEIIDATV